MSYNIENLVADIKSLRTDCQDEAQLMDSIRPLAIRAAMDPGLIDSRMYVADEELGYGSTLLHEESDQTLFIVVDSWLPGRGVRPHDHGTWAVVVSMTGTEKNILWQRVDDGRTSGYAKLEKGAEIDVGIGEAITLATGEIHSVENQGSETTLSLHIYGYHLNHTGRSQFDPETQSEFPFIIETQ